MKTKLFTLLLAVAASVGTNAKLIDLTAIGTTIDEWTVSEATLNTTRSDESKGKYVYDIKGGIASDAYINAEPNVVFQRKMVSDKTMAFAVYPGKCYEFGGSNGILILKGTQAGDTIKLTAAAKGHIDANFADADGTYPKNAVAVSEDLTLPAKQAGAEGADEQGYIWKVLEFESLGGDVEIKEFAGGYRIKSIQICNQTSVWEETFSTRRGSTYIAQVNLGSYYAWPYANQWFTGYEAVDPAYNVEGNQYDNDYTNVASYGVSIRGKKLNGSDKNTVGLYFSSNKPAEQNYVLFEGGLPTISNGGVLKLDVCATEVDNGGTLNEMIITINNGIVLNIPATTLGAKLVTSTIEVNLPPVQIDSLKIAFNNAPSYRFISRMWIEDRYVCYDGICFYLDTVNQTAAVTANPIHYTGDITIPTHITHENVIYSVVGIGDNAFLNCSGLTSIEIPNSVTSIGSGAFEGCSGLTSIEIPNGVTSIGNYAFQSCRSLTSVTIPNSVTSIGSSAFWECYGLTSVTIPNSVTSIRAWTFFCCSGLTSVTIPNSVTSIGDHAFDGCTGLISVSIPNSVTSIGDYAFDGCTGLISVSIPNSVTSIGDYAFYGCSGLTSVTIPNSVTSIGYGAFYGCSGLTSVTIPNSVTSIGYGAFAACTGLTSVTIGNSVTSIGEYAFCQCYGLTSVTIEADTPPTIGIYCFNFLYNEFFPLNISIYVPCGSLDTYKTAEGWSDYASRIKYAPLPYKISTQAENGSVATTDVATISICEPFVTCTAMPDYGYHFTQWSDGNTDNPRTVVLTQNMTFTAEFAADRSGTCGKNNLLQWTFADDGTLTISGSGELTENYTFGVEAPTQMQQLVIGNEVTSIGERAFYEKTTLQKLIIGSNVTSIGKYAFASINNRQLTSLVMPAELLTIGDYAFSGNTYLESIDFNAKLQSIGAYAFKDCYRVSEMTCLATVTPDLGTDALASINSYASLCVPAECLRKYQVDPNWGRFDLCELGTTSTVTENRMVTVEPTDNTAIFTWPTENNAASYSLQITKDGVVFCTLVFNSNGQLTGIAFAPGRNGAAHAPAATMSVAGMSFTVTGLDGASKYAYRLAVTNDASEELVAYSGEFATTGYDGEVNPGGNPEGLDEISSSLQGGDRGRLILHNGQIFILRGDKTYTLDGRLVK